MTLSSPTLGERDSLVVSVDVRNTGAREGVEVVQLYVQDEVGSVTRPVKELRGFRRVALRAGESKRVSFTLYPSDLSFHDAELALVSEPGAFRVFIGGSSEQVQEGRFDLRLDAGCAMLELPQERARFMWTESAATWRGSGLQGVCRGSR